MSGFPAVFIRLTGCNLRCDYCDTTYAFEEGDEMTIDEITGKVAEFECGLVEITGGEPMMQENTPLLAKALVERGHTVMVETNGSYDISILPEPVIKIVDIKSPDSGAGDSFRYENLESLNDRDEIKFVVSSADDFEWAVSQTKEHNLVERCILNISPVPGKVEPSEAAQWILDSGLNFRLNLQLHKQIDLQ
jgi:7-carboxy-7-deazaguanine synthase